MRGIFSTKSIDAILGDARPSEYSLKRALGPLQITMLGIGAIIGAGIFATIGTAAAGDMHRLGAGPGLMLSFGLAGAVCVFVALCYAEFASIVPISGSAYTYSYATLGELVAWIIGWDLIIEYAVGNVAVAISCANYLKTFLSEAGIIIPDWVSVDFETARKIPGLLESAPHIFGVPIVFNLVAFLIVAAITVILLIGIRESAWFTTGMVIVKLAVLTLFIFIGVRYLKVDNWKPFLPNGFIGVASGAAVIFFAYIGFDAVSTVAEETKKPQKDLPIGILASLAVCTLFYIIVAGVFTGMIPYSDLVRKLSTEQAEPLTLALKYANIKGMAIYVVALGSVIAHIAVLFVFQLGQPRILFSMARDGLLPRAFAGVHKSFRTPWFSTIVTGAAVGTAALFTNLEEMVDLTNIGTLFAFILVSVGIIVLRYKQPGMKRSFRVPGGIVIPVLGALGCLGLIYYLPPTSWLRFAAWLNVGFLIYFYYGSLRSRLTGVRATENYGSLLAGTSFSGGWLGFAGTAMLFAARAADIRHSGSSEFISAIFTNSWWLTVPMLLNMMLLCPTIILRAYKAKKAGISKSDIVHADLSIILSALLFALSAIYLLFTVAI
jgi:APA family basic amino acid/polyamine antiporter